MVVESESSARSAAGAGRDGGCADRRPQEDCLTGELIQKAAGSSEQGEVLSAAGVDWKWAGCYSFYMEKSI